MRTGTETADGGVNGGNAEYKHRGDERQHEEAEQDAAPPQGHRQGRAHRSDQAQRWGPEQHRDHEYRESLGAHVEKQGQDRRRRDQGNARRQPMGQALGQDQDFDRQRPQRQQIETAVVVIGPEKPVQGQHRRQQRRHPDGPGRDPGQKIYLRPHAKGEQGDGENEKHHDRAAVAAAGERQPQVPSNDGEEAVHHISPARHRTTRR